MGVAPRHAAGQHGLLRAREQHQSIAAGGVVGRQDRGAADGQQWLAALEFCRQLGRDQTRNSVHAAPDPNGMAALTSP